MLAAPSHEELMRDARWLVQAMDPASNTARLVEMSSDDYRAASFLDDRMFQRSTSAGMIPWPKLQAAASAQGREDARWIFHIGHVGSTLVARLLGELSGVLSIREPRSLRDIMAVEPDKRSAYGPPLRKLFSRTFAPNDVALVKATSFVSEFGSELIPSRGRGLFMFAQPRAYIASILAGENSRKELHALAGFRESRLMQRGLKLDLAAKGEAHLAAAAWACEMTSLETAADALGEASIGWADFDQMLEDIPYWLPRAAELLGLPAAPEEISSIASGPLMGRYSKALEFDYSPGLRRDLLNEANLLHRRDIESALDLLEQAAASSPLLARSLGRATSEI